MMIAKSLRLCFFLMLSALVANSALAATGGIDTPNPSKSLPLSVGGNPGMELAPPQSGEPPDLAVYGNTTIDKKLKVTDTATFDNNIGIGSTAPTTSLDINGAMKVGVTSKACTAALAGAIRYNAATSVFEGCNGSAWAALGSSGIKRCRVCFWERGWDGDTQNGQCTNTSGCSDWSTSPGWSSPINDDTDKRGGGCFYSFMIQCE